MKTQPAERSFRLDALPPYLCSMGRMVKELRVDDKTIRRWVREGRLPGPTRRRGDRAYRQAADVEPFKARRLRYIGAE